MTTPEGNMRAAAGSREGSRRLAVRAPSRWPSLAARKNWCCVAEDGCWCTSIGGRRHDATYCDF